MITHLCNGEAIAYTDWSYEGELREFFQKFSLVIIVFLSVKLLITVGVSELRKRALCAVNYCGT